MDLMNKIVVACFIALIAIFISSDSDLLLFVLPDKSQAQNVFVEKVIWITGASSGIGASLARDSSVAGANVVISARRTAELESVAIACKELGAKEVTVLPLDVTDHNMQQEVYDQIIKKYGKLDILILNPGRTQRALALNTTLESTQLLMNLNFMSFVSLAKIVIPGMIERGGGSLVVISSISGKMGTPVSSSYSASKWALHGYFDAVRAEYSNKGIHILMVCPGPVVTDITNHAIKGKGSEDTVIDSKENAAKMSTERCTQLIMKAIYYKFDEVWISMQPFLFITYLSVYAPGLSRFLFKRLLGPARVSSFLNNGNVFDVQQIFREFFSK